MATYTEPLETQPEFDDIGPLRTEDRLLLRILGPFLTAMNLVMLPVRMYGTHRRQRGYIGRPASAAEWAAMAPSARNYLELAERTLSSRGFADPRHEVIEVSPTTRSYVVHLFNASTHELATIIVSIVPRRLFQTLVGFRTWWDDGRQTSTSNNDQAELFSSLHQPRHIDSLSLPGVEDLQRLYDVHRARCAERGAHRPIGNGWEDPVDNPSSLLRRSFDAMDERLLESGVCRMENDEFMRLTVKGAILMTWSRLEPFESYLAWKGRRRTAAALRRYT
jgi:hypothetical protein